MSGINLNFMHPTDGRVISVELDSTMTGNEIVNELIASDFINASTDGYKLFVKGGNELRMDYSLEESNVQDGNTLRVVPATDAGQC